MIKAIMNGVPKDVIRIPMHANGIEHEGWEVRDQNGAILWAANKTLTGTSSIPMKGYGLPLVGMTLEGDETQTGTPTPDSPIWPDETGERTGNLWNEDYTGISGNLTYAPIYVGDGSFTLSTSCPAVESAAALFFLAGNVQSGASTASNGVYKNRPITVASIDGYITIAYRYVNTAGGSAYPQNEKTMLNTGSTALPYEPFGYKIPIALNSVTQNIYLNEPLRKIGDYADTISSDGTVTRRIKKLVLTGRESPSRTTAITDTDAWQFPNETGDYYRTTYLVSHMPVNTSSIAAYSHGFIGQRLTLCYDKQLGLDTNSAVKSYLAAQYAAGTPVTVWYVLATPTTEQVTVPTLTPADGNDTLTVNTTLAPSALSITGHVKARN